MPLPRRYIPSLAALRALEAVDRLGTATAAALDLNLTQSAVSRQLQQLEEQLGATLVTREGRKLLLTEAGRNYAADVRDALNQIARASMQLHAAPGARGISLAILPSFGMRWLVPRLAHFAALHPDVPVNLTTRLADVDFQRDGLDAAIRFGNGVWQGCRSLHLGDERTIPLCAPSLMDRPVTDPAELSNMSLLHIQTRPNAWQDWFTAQGVQSSPAQGAMFDQFSTITQAAIHGLGVALLPDFIAETELASGRLIPAFDAYSASRDSYYLVWPDKQRETEALRLFRDWIATQTDDNLPR